MVKEAEFLCDVITSPVCTCYKDGLHYCAFHNRSLPAKKHCPSFLSLTIPHKSHRYPTVGDFWGDRNAWQLRVSEMSDIRFEFLVLLHEMVEMMLMMHRGIPEEIQGEFDRMYEKERADGKHKPEDEPGFDPRSPYLAEHTFASHIEEMMAKELGVDWETFANEVDHL
jgi:hypothetical protein